MKLIVIELLWRGPNRLYPKLQEIVLVPAALAVTNPPELTEATEAEEELQVAVVVMSAVLPSPYVPIAVNC